jgi:hypothetical protein
MNFQVVFKKRPAIGGMLHVLDIAAGRQSLPMLHDYPDETEHGVVQI